MQIDLDTYNDAEAHYLGYCPDCDALTREQTESDAEGYDCPECGGNRVMGVGNALIDGALEF